MDDGGEEGSEREVSVSREFHTLKLPRYFQNHPVITLSSFQRIPR